VTRVPQLGERVGAGAMSEVFAWDEGRVVKLFLAAYDFAVERELECARAVNQAGIASPAVHDVVEVDGRRGIVYDRVDGPTLLDQLLRAERSPRDVGRTLAAVHLAMHVTTTWSSPCSAAGSLVSSERSPGGTGRPRLVVRRPPGAAPAARCPRSGGLRRAAGRPRRGGRAP
jgi:hypothetical protein